MLLIIILSLNLVYSTQQFGKPLDYMRRSPENYLRDVKDPMLENKSTGPTSSIKNNNEQNNNHQPSEKVAIQEYENDIIIISANIHVDRDTLEPHQIKNLGEIINDDKPSIIALQGATKEVYMSVLEYTKDFDAVCKNSEYIDVRFNKKEFLPILYRKDKIISVKEQYFSNDKQHYGCIVTFITRKGKEIFTVANGDLYSINENRTDDQIDDILSYFKNSIYTEFPLFFTGTINNMGEVLRKLVNDNFLNLVSEDKSNAGIGKTTFHNHGTLNDNFQRDYILMSDPKEKFRFISSQIMTDVSKNVFQHYPIYSRLEIKQRKEQQPN